QTEVPVQPQKAVVLDWSTLDTLAQLGVTVAGIPSGNPPEVLRQYREGEFIRAGSLFEPDLEVLRTAQPDLIILGRRAQGKYEEVSAFGTTIDLTPDPNDLLGSVERNTLLLGEIFGKQERAAELVAQLKASVDELRALTAKQGDGLLILTTGGKMAAFGKGTRFGLIHDVFDVEQAVAELKAGCLGGRTGGGGGQRRSAGSGGILRVSAGGRSGLSVRHCSGGGKRPARDRSRRAGGQRTGQGDQCRQQPADRLRRPRQRVAPGQ